MEEATPRAGGARTGAAAAGAPQGTLARSAARGCSNRLSYLKLVAGKTGRETRNKRTQQPPARLRAVLPAAQRADAASRPDIGRPGPARERGSQREGSQPGWDCKRARKRTRISTLAKNLQCWPRPGETKRRGRGGTYCARTASSRGAPQGRHTATYERCTGQFRQKTAAPP